MEWLKKILEFLGKIGAAQHESGIDLMTTQKAVKDNITEMGLKQEDRKIQWKKSPNYSIRKPREISAIILHHTANYSLENAVDWMCDPEARVSAHYAIGLDGSIVQMVLDQHIAWHAGRSALDGRQHVNNYSIGIEMVGNTCEKPLTGVQWDAMVWLVQRLMKKYNVAPHRVVDHRKISPGRKVDLDPVNFDWLKFYEAIG